jgi:acetylglutamate kinase
MPLIGAETMQESITKASHLIETLAYIRRFSGKTFVVKCGGSALTDLTQMQNIMRDLAWLQFCGIKLVLVHGGGPDISSLCEKLQLPVQFSQGQRVTDAATMEVVQMVLLGKTNRALVTTLNQLGVKAVGFSGQDSAFIKVKPWSTECCNLGYVGEIINVDTNLLHTLLAENYFPVIVPIGVDFTGQAYNVNADFSAAAIAVALAAEKLIILSDVDGYYADATNPASRLDHIHTTLIEEWLTAGKIDGGMIPKLQACLTALKQTVKSCHLLDGKMPHSLLLEIFTGQGVGTLITHQEKRCQKNLKI